MMSLPDQLVYLIIRFASSIPDLSLHISSPRTTTTVSLKQLIRAELPFAQSSSRLRLIYAGKVLADTVPLSTSLRLPAPPPSSRRDGGFNDHTPGSKSKGKQPVQDNDAGNSEKQELKRYYIHCSLGDALSPEDLATEARLAETTTITLQKQNEPSESSNARRRASSGAISSGTGSRARGNSSTTTPAPQGFDKVCRRYKVERGDETHHAS